MENSTVFALVVGEAFRFYGEFSSNRDQQILREQANALDTLDKFVLLPLQETEWRVKVMLRAVATSSLQPVLLSRAQQQFGSRLVHSKHTAGQHNFGTFTSGEHTACPQVGSLNGFYWQWRFSQLVFSTTGSASRRAAKSSRRHDLQADCQAAWSDTFTAPGPTPAPSQPFGSS